MDLFAVNQAGIINRENARRKRPPSGLIVDYDNTSTKDKTLPKKDKIVPDFKKMSKKKTDFSKVHDYYGV